MESILIVITGWIGSILLAACGIPLARAAIQDNSIAKNLSSGFLNCWLWGEVFILIYAAMLGKDLIPVLFNVSFNIICILIILWIRWRTP